MKSPTGTKIGVYVATLLTSISVHVALAAALILATDRADLTASAPSPAVGSLIWVTHASSVESTGTPARSASATPVSTEAPRQRTAPRSRASETAAEKSPTGTESVRRPASAPTLATTAGAPARSPDSKPSSTSARTSPITPPIPAGEVQSPTDAPRLAGASPRESGHNSGAPVSGAKRSRPNWPNAGLVDTPARPRWPIRPEYPRTARRKGDESMVVVEAWVDGGGAVAFSSVLESGGPDFDESALKAVRRSSFDPARLQGRVVASRVALRIHFALRN